MTLSTIKARLAESPDADLAWCVAEIERLRVLSETRSPMCQCSDDEACRFVRERDKARALLPSPAVLEVLGLAHERLVDAILDGDVVVAYDMAIDEAGEWLERMVERG